MKFAGHKPLADAHLYCSQKLLYWPGSEVKRVFLLLCRNPTKETFWSKLTSRRASQQWAAFARKPREICRLLTAKFELLISHLYPSQDSYNFQSTFSLKIWKDSCSGLNTVITQDSLFNMYLLRFVPQMLNLHL